MRALRTVLGLGLCLAGTGSLSAGTIPLPADISVALTAEPDSHLQSGQRIAFTVSVTNHGPEPATPVTLSSSPIYDELDVFSGSSDCRDNLGLIVVDLDHGFYYALEWDPTLNAPPLAVGETRTCHIDLDFTEWAPDTFSLTFSMPAFLVDLDGSNNSATATLRRGIQGIATPVPTLSSVALVILTALLLLVGSFRDGRRQRQTATLSFRAFRDALKSNAVVCPSV